MNITKAFYASIFLIFCVVIFITEWQMYRRFTNCTDNLKIYLKQQDALAKKRFDKFTALYTSLDATFNRLKKNNNQHPSISISSIEKLNEGLTRLIEKNSFIKCAVKLQGNELLTIKNDVHLIHNAVEILRVHVAEKNSELRRILPDIRDIRLHLEGLTTRQLATQDLQLLKLKKNIKDLNLRVKHDSREQKTKWPHNDWD